MKQPHDEAALARAQSNYARLKSFGEEGARKTFSFDLVENVKSALYELTYKTGQHENSKRKTQLIENDALDFSWLDPTQRSNSAEMRQEFRMVATKAFNRELRDLAQQIKGEPHNIDLLRRQHWVIYAARTDGISVDESKSNAKAYAIERTTGWRRELLEAQRSVNGHGQTLLDQKTKSADEGAGKGL